MSGVVSPDLDRQGHGVIFQLKVGRRDSELLDGRSFDAAPWDAADAEVLALAARVKALEAVAEAADYYVGFVVAGDSLCPMARARGRLRAALAVLGGDRPHE